MATVEERKQHVKGNTSSTAAKMNSLFFVVPKELSGCSPSVRDGVPYAVERNNRAFMCGILSQAGILLKLPQATLSTAQILLHRFYYRRSMRSCAAFDVGLTCLYLATKVEESQRSISDIFNVLDRLLKRLHGLPLSVLRPNSHRFLTWRDTLKSMEIIILKELGFHLYVEHPHRFLLSYVHFLGGDAELAQVAWNFLNDVMQTDLCVHYPPEVLATSALWMTARLKGTLLPERPPWWEVFGVKESDIHVICAVMADHYAVNKPRSYIPLDDADEHGNPLFYATRNNSPASTSVQESTRDTVQTKGAAPTET